MALHQTTRSVLNTLIKLLVVIAFGWFVSRRITQQGDVHDIWQAFVDNWRSGPAWMAVLAILLMPLNWLMETVKWRTLLRPGIMLSWKRAIAGILSGITLSLFTPNRTGEYGARILYVNPGDRWKAVIASLTGSFAQNVIYVAFGVFSLLFFVSFQADLSEMMQRGVRILAVASVIALVCLYFYLPVIARMLSSRKPPGILRKPWEALSHLQETSRTTLRRALLFSFCRYGIFTFQYVLLLRYFGVLIPWQKLVGGVSVIFLVQTSVPLPPLVDLLARNEVGLTIWAPDGANELSVIAAGLTIWIINLAFPAFIGLLAIATVNVLRTFGYDKTNLPVSRPRSDSSVDG